MFEQIQPLVDQKQPPSKRYVGIWVGVVSPKGEFAHGFGERELGKANPPDERTFFEIGSISKTFTGISLALKGLDLNRKAEDFLPAGIALPTYNGTPIALLHLVTHTAAFPSIAADIDSLQKFLRYTPVDAYAFLKNFELRRAPGSEYEYSNLGFALLSHILEGSFPDEQTSRYEKLVANITEALEMKESVISLNAEQQSRLTQAYDNDGNPEAHWDWGTNSINSGAGALKSTGHDMMKFLKANLGLQRSSIQNAIEKSHTELFRVNDSLSIGYGWHISKIGSERIAWHNGGTSGFQTFLGFNKEKQTGVIVLANTAHHTDESPVDPRIDLAALSNLQSLE